MSIGFLFLIMIRFKLYISVCLSLILLSSPLYSNKVIDEHQAGLDSCRKYAQKLKDSLFIPGMQITIMQDNAVLWNKSFGYSDLLNMKKVQPYTKFRIASVSKMFTSSAIMKLMEQGKIELDSAVRYYMPDYPARRFPIPIRTLLNHTSGIRHYEGNEFANPKKYKNLNEALNMFKNDTLLFEPGTKALYSSFGYNLLGAVIERITKMRYQDYVYKYLLSPLKLNRTMPDRNDNSITNRTNFYMMNSKKVIIECEPYDLTHKIPTGGYLSTSSDLAKYCSELLAGKVLSDSVLNIYLSPTYLKDESPSHWCLGLRITPISKKYNVYWQLGTTYGASSAIAFEPKTKTVISWITNMNVKWTENDILQMMKYMLKVEEKD